MVIENLFHAKNVKSALVLGHARGVAVLAAVNAGVPVLEYTPAEIKASVAGYGRAAKTQMGHMVKLLLGLAEAPTAARRSGRSGGRDVSRACKRPARRARRRGGPRAAQPSQLAKRQRR